jgi:hypothetical protein
MTQEIDQLAEQMATQAQQSAPATVDVPIEQPQQEQSQNDAPRRRRQTPQIPEIKSEMKWLSSLSALMGCLWLATAPLLVVSHWFPLTHVIAFVVVGSLGLMGYLVIRDDFSKSTAYVWAWLMAMSGYAAILLTGVSK